MPIFTATATALLASTALAGSFIATNLLASGLAYATGHILGVYDVPDVDIGSGAEDQGVELRLAANTQNRIPTLYGVFMERGRTVYAEVSDDKQNYHTVIALGEGPITSMDRIFWNEYELSFDGSGVVTNAVAPDGTATSKYNGLITIQTYLGTATGNNSTYLENLSSTWTSTDKMTNIVYAVVSIKYDREAGVTGLADIRFVGTSPVTNPANAIEDLLTNTRYGLGLSSADINSASFTAAADYFDEMVDYVDLDGVTVQQTRHTVNGSLSTSNDVINRIQSIGRGCNTELTWSDGQWGLFVNRQDTVTSFVFNTSNIIGNIQVVEPGLNSLFNRVEINFGRNAENNYQRASSFVESPAAVLYPNELTRTQTFDLPLVNTSQEAKRTATVNLNQARQQLTVSHTADATAMPLEAGDIVRYTDADYGWVSKPFRITSITEVNEEASLTYQVTAVEYASSVYNFVVNEDDVAPNVPENDVATIEAVDDLVITGSFRSTATPYIALQWTVPDNSLVENFTVFYNLINTTFDSSNTKLGGVEQIPNGNYTNGAVVSHQLVGVPAGNVSIWVVANNSFVSSLESNRAALDGWAPTAPAAAVFDNITRYNATPSVVNGVNIDVGAPPANATATGTGRNNYVDDTGWYAFDPEASNRNNAPVWVATSEVQRTNVSSRVIDFTHSGTAATQETVFTDVSQITDFAFSGTVGEREFFYNARPEITDFTLTGQGADYDVDVNEQWSITTSGSSEATGPDINDVFYIAPRGTSNTFVGESFTFTPSGNTGDGSTVQNDLPGTFLFDASSGIRLVYVQNTSVGETPAERFFLDPAQSNVAGIISTLNSVYGTNIVQGVNFNRVFASPVDIPFAITENGTQTLTLNNILRISYSQGGDTFNVYGTTADTTGVAPTVNTSVAAIAIAPPVQSSVSITLDTVVNTYTFANNLSGGVAIGTALNTAIGTDFTGFTKTFNASTGAVTLTANDVNAHTSSVAVVAGTNGTLTVAPSNTASSGTLTTIQLMVTTESIDETITVDSNITGSALRTDVFNKFNAITSITDEFTVELVTIDISGTDTEVIRFTANDFVDHVFMVAVNSGITGTTSGTIVDGTEATTPTSIRITYDDGITPIFQDITFAGADANTLASDLQTLIDSHGELSATVLNNVVTITHDNPGPVDEPVVSITTQGTGDAAFVVATVTEGVTAAGTATSYVATYLNQTVLAGDFSMAADQDTMAAELRLAINSSSTHTATVVDNVVTTTSIDNDGADLTIVVTQGTNKPGGVSTNDAVIARAVTRIGSSVDVFGGTDASVTVEIGGNEYYTNTYGGNTLVELTLDVVNGINVDNPAFTNHFTSVVKAGDGNELRATSDFVGTTPTMTITVTTGSTATVDAIGNVTVLLASLAVSRTVIENGQTNPVINGILSTFTVTQGSETIIAATDLTSGFTATQVATFITNSIAMNLQSMYTTVLTGTVITATSEFNNDEPDLTITITAGTNADATDGDLAVVKLVTQEGNTGVSDLSTAVWEYAVTAPTTDDDLIMVDPVTGVITARRGLVLNTTELQTTSAGYTEFDVISDTTHTVGDRDATLVFTGLVALPSISTNLSDGLNSVGYDLQYTTESDPSIPTSLLLTGLTYTAASNTVPRGRLVLNNTDQFGALPATFVWDTFSQDSFSMVVTDAIHDALIDFLGTVNNLSEMPYNITVTNLTQPGSIVVIDATAQSTANNGVDNRSYLLTVAASNFSANGTSTGTFDSGDEITVLVERTSDTVWTTLDTLDFNTAFPDAFAGQLVPVPMGIGASLDSDPDLTYSFRLQRTGDFTIGGFSWNMVILEELRA